MRIARALQPLWHPRLYLLSGLFLFGGGVGIASGSWQNLCAQCPSVAQIQMWEPEQTSKLFTADGQLIVELGREVKTPVSVQTLPPHVPQAVVAIEDRRFYEHGGFDLRGFTRAVLGVLTGQNLGGGSTITQQLARNMFEGEIGFERRYTRKLKELQVAFELERSYTKDQILESYMNEIYMGRGWGFESAARGYFGKNLTQVNVAEAALLAALPKSPSTTYNPFVNPESARTRRNLVLSAMAEEGYITEGEAEQWKEYPLPTRDFGRGGLHGPAPYFEEWVRQILDDRYGEKVYSGGLRVYTTLDLDMQMAAEEAMRWGWEAIEAQPNFLFEPYAEHDTLTAMPGQTPYLQGAFVALDPHTGHVKAMIGGRNFDQSKFDRVRLAHRQAGSSFKPFVYTAAIQSGLPASHIVEDQPVVLPQVDGTEWIPSNFDPAFLGPITMRQGLRLSINMVAIRVGWEEVGIETVRQVARRMGIQTEIEPFPSTTIGAVEVIPIELAEAYASLATLGTRVRPFPILRVEDAEGRVLWEPQPERTRALDSAVARIVVDMLQEAANAGTGPRHYSVPGTLDRDGGGTHPRIPTAGKTGTTNDGTNTWFSAFTPNLVATVWFGMDRPQPMARLGTRPQATGGMYAAPVWGRFMNHVYHGMPDSLAVGLFEGLPESEAAAESRRASMQADSTEIWAGGVLPIPAPWPIPATITTREIDRRSGKLWSSYCSDPETNRYVELYLPGTEPTEWCDDTSLFRFRLRR